jgi:hypothetical protein
MERNCLARREYSTKPGKPIGSGEWVLWAGPPAAPNLYSKHPAHLENDIYRILGKDNILLEDTAFSVILKMGRVLGIQVRCRRWDSIASLVTLADGL